MLGRDLPTTATEAFEAAKALKRSRQKDKITSECNVILRRKNKSRYSENVIKFSMPIVTYTITNSFDTVIVIKAKIFLFTHVRPEA